MKTKEINPEVLYSLDEYPAFSGSEIAELRNRARSNPSGKIRICMHEAPESALHEMLIALRNDVRYPVHKCPARSETHIVLDGLMTVNLFHDDGAIRERVPMGPPDSGRCGYLRVPANMFHSIRIETEVCVFMEVKLGPFDPADNVKADFPDVE